MPKTATRSEPVGRIEPSEPYTYEEIAAFARATPRQVRRWVEEGRLGYVQYPQGRRVLGRHFLDFIEGRSVSAEG